MRRHGASRQVIHIGALAARVLGYALLLLTHNPVWYLAVMGGEVAELALAIGRPEKAEDGESRP